jgi:hypothetical protein
LAPGGETGSHSSLKAEEAISNHVKGMNPDCLREDFQWVNLAGFKKCCISNALDGTEDDILWQDVEDENDDNDCEDDGDEQSDREDSE